MTIVAVMRPEPRLAKTILGSLDGKAVGNLPPYKPWLMRHPCAARRTQGRKRNADHEEGPNEWPVPHLGHKGKHLFVPLLEGIRLRC